MPDQHKIFFQTIQEEFDKMEMQKQKPPRKKNKIITKRKVLSATMSGTLLMTSVV